MSGDELYRVTWYDRFERRLGFMEVPLDYLFVIDVHNRNFYSLSLSRVGSK